MECPVCFEPLAGRIRALLPCEHTLCMRCLLRLRPPRCPLCRADLTEYFDPPRQDGPRFTTEVTLQVNTPDAAADVIRQTMQRMRVLRDLGVAHPPILTGTRERTREGGAADAALESSPPPSIAP